MGKTNGLSWQLDWKVGVENDNNNQVFIKDCQLHSLYKVVIDGPEVDIVEKIKKARSKDEEVVRIVENMKKTGIKMLQEEEQQIEEDLVLKKRKVYVLIDEILRIEIIQLHRNVPVAEHGGKWKTMELVTRNYQWLGVMRDVGKYVEDCNICQRIKNRIEVIIGKLKLSEILEKPWTHLIVDFITKLPLVAGKDVILVVCNRLSKMTYFVTTTKETLAERLARLFRDNIWKLHGLPESIVLDIGPQFAVKMTKELNSMLEIEMKLSTAFYPQTDDQTKRINQELKQYLRFFIDHKQKDWPE